VRAFLKKIHEAQPKRHFFECDENLVKHSQKVRGRDWNLMEYVMYVESETEILTLSTFSIPHTPLIVFLYT
jgi:hypothetical protein